MANNGLIKHSSVEELKARVRIEEVVGEHVMLKPAGAGSLKGLCPFHDEKTASFHVRPALGVYHCFGCGEGGDTIEFVQKINHLTFKEAVEYLASKYGVKLEYEDAGRGYQQRPDQSGLRQRLLAANEVAAEFFAENLQSPPAQIGRDFLARRGFGPDVAAHFGLGYAPDSWDQLLRHLRSRGFTEAEIEGAGLATRGNKGLYDRFRGRLIWPIKDQTGAIVGFGARQLKDQDGGAKYLNTPETLLYKKSTVLYGLDLAKKAISRKRRIVVVEGYTDVMAAHLAGIEEAVATCGTAFGPEHVRIVRRFLGDASDPSAGVILSSGKAHGGEVIFTFDGDAAGRKAALRAFNEDQNFASQTFVAVEPSGMDPCELRLAKGDRAVVELVENRKPLFEFVIKSVLEEIDLGTAEGRVRALRAGAPIVGQIRDRALRMEYSRALAGWIGMDEDQVYRAVAAASRGPRRAPTTDTGRIPMAAARQSAGNGRPRREDPAVRIQRQALEAALQYPFACLDQGFDAVDSQSFTTPAYAAVFQSIQAAGGLAAYRNDPRFETDKQGAAAAWVAQIRQVAGEHMDGVLTALVSAPTPQLDNPEALNNYCQGVVKALVRLDINRRAAALQAHLQRMESNDPEYGQVFQALMELEKKRRATQGDAS